MFELRIYKVVIYQSSVLVDIPFRAAHFVPILSVVGWRTKWARFFSVHIVRWKIKMKAQYVNTDIEAEFCSVGLEPSTFARQPGALQPKQAVV